MREEGKIVNSGQYVLVQQGKENVKKKNQGHKDDDVWISRK